MQPPWPSPHHQPPPSPSDRTAAWVLGLGVAALAVVAVGGLVLVKSVAFVARSPEERERAAGPPVSAPEVTLERVRRAYADNEVAANQSYRGRWLTVRATVASVGQDEDGIVLRLRPQKLTPSGDRRAADDSGMSDARAFLRDGQASRAARLRSGDEVRLLCVGAGRNALDEPMFRDCAVR